MRTNHGVMVSVELDDGAVVYRHDESVWAPEEPLAVTAFTASGAEPAWAVWDRVAAYAVGTTDPPAALAERFGVDEDLVEDQLGERSIHVCADCGWWFDEDAEGASDGDFDPVCADCR